MKVCRRREPGDERGAVSPRFLVWALIILAALYGGYKFVRPTFSYYMLSTDVKEEAKLAHMYTNESLRRRIIEKARTWDVPLRPEDVVIDRGIRDITIRVFYTDRIEFFGRYRKVLKRRISVTVPLKESSGILR